MLIRKNKSERGVAAIFFLAVIGLLLGFFMMVINTGLLIYAKMRLQTAVDLAAYSAASVQAAYLGNEQSGEGAISVINQKIIERYGELLEDLQFGSVVPPPMLIPEYASCVAACVAGNLANGARAQQIYKNAAQDLEVYRQQVGAILAGLPEATRKAAEETIKLNIPLISMDGGALGGETTNQADEVSRVNSEAGRAENVTDQRKNAILTFSSKKGMYLANVVASVPHSFTYFGPACFNANLDKEAPPMYYCAVNGSGAPGGSVSQAMAMAAYARAFTKTAIGSGNIGTLTSISDKDANSIRLHFIPNAHRPDPFVTVAAEWYPPSGAFLNFENSFGANGSLFPKRTRLVAVASAEPFGGNLASLQDTSGYGTRLQSIRKNLLDSRMRDVKDDFPHLYDYFGSLSPRDINGSPVETPYQVIRRFLH